MEYVIQGRSPRKLYDFFEQISAIPRGSRNEKEISEYLLAFAAERGLRVWRDDIYNVIIWKDGQNGGECQKPVLLECHTDIVCAKTPDSTHDFLHDPIRLIQEGNILHADRTTLGADNGCGVATILYILDSKDFPHPPLECYFASQEEIGLIGASNIDVSKFKARRAIGLDAGTDGVLCEGASSKYTYELCHAAQWEENHNQSWKLTVSGLMGGHSGAEIDKNRANANSLLGKFLHGLDEKTDFELISVQGGQKDNAITREATAEILVLEENVDAVREYAASVQGAWREEYAGTDEGITVTVEDEGKQEVRVLHPTSKEKVIFFLVNVPYGVQKMSGTIKGLVETSTNIGILKTSENEVMGSSSIRSSVETARDSLSDKIAYLTEFLGGEYERQGVYPAWEYRKDSPLRDKMVEVYEEMYGQKPNVVAIHAGLECGLFYKKMEGLDCVSLGPDMKDIHTSEEVLSISSTERVWKYLVKVLEALKE